MIETDLSTRTTLKFHSVLTFVNIHDKKYKMKQWYKNMEVSKIYLEII